MRRFTTGLAVLALAAFVQAEDKRETKVAEGQPAPEVELQAATTKGTAKINLKEYKDKKNVVTLLTITS
jgi:hypothetical protein